MTDYISLGGAYWDAITIITYLNSPGHTAHNDDL